MGCARAPPGRRLQGVTGAHIACKNNAMSTRTLRPLAFARRGMVGVAPALFVCALAGAGGADRASPPAPKDESAAVVQPLVKQYCLSCHSTKVKKGDLDLERFGSLDHVRKDLKPWQAMVEMLESGEM